MSPVIRLFKPFLILLRCRDSSMIPREIIKKIKRVHIKSSRTVNTLMAGQYRSVFRGSGIEFEEVREYAAGDDVKAIDWKVSARLGRPFIKLYREERESIVMLLVDMSASQKFGTFHGQKLEKAAEVASVLAFSAVRNNDKVGVIFFTDRVEKYIPPKKGSNHIWRVIKEIFTFEPQGKGTDMGAALEFLGSVSRKKTVSFLISDFIAEGYHRSLRAARVRHELIGVLLYDPHDFKLPDYGMVSMVCPETGRQMLFDAGDPSIRQYYKEQKEALFNKSLESCKRASMDVIQMGTNLSVSDALAAYFRFREKRMR